MKVWIDATVLTLHSAVLFFFIGLVIFLWSEDQVIAHVLLGFTGSMVMLYAWLTIIPPICGILPNINPVTSLIVNGIIQIKSLTPAKDEILHIPWRFVQIIIVSSKKWPPKFGNERTE